MTLELPDIVIETLINALNDGILIQKQARLCDLAALDFIPSEILPCLKLHHQKAIATSSATSEKILLNLASFKNRKIKLAVLKNKNISHLTLVALNKDADCEIRRLILTHEQTPGELIIEYQKDYPWRYCHGYDSLFIKAASAKHTNLEVLRKLSKSEDWRVRQSVAGNRKTPVDVLKILAKDTFWNTPTGSPYVRQEVAKNPSTPLNLLEELANDFNRYVREGVSNNPRIPLYLLEQLARRSERHISLNLLKNPFTPSNVIEIIFCSVANSIYSFINKQKFNNRPGGQYLSLIAKHRNTPPEILQSFFDNNFGYRALAENSSTPQKILVELANNSENDIREKIAQNSSTSRETLFALSKDKSKHVQISIANNPNAPSILLRRLSELNLDININYIQKALAQNPSTPTDILEKLAKHRDFSLKFAVASNTSTPLHVLENISHCGIHKVKITAMNRIRLIHQDIASNPEASTEELQEMVKHQDVKVRLAVTQHPQGLSLLLDRCLKAERCLPEQNSLNRVLAGMHPEIFPQQIDSLFHSENWLDRLSVACNSSLSEECLMQLAEDKNDIVKQAAKELLSKRTN